MNKHKKPQNRARHLPGMEWTDIASLERWGYVFRFAIHHCKGSSTGMTASARKRSSSSDEDDVPTWDVLRRDINEKKELVVTFAVTSVRDGCGEYYQCMDGEGESCTYRRRTTISGQKWFETGPVMACNVRCSLNPVVGPVCLFEITEFE